MSTINWAAPAGSGRGAGQQDAHERSGQGDQPDRSGQVEPGTVRARRPAVRADQLQRAG